MILAGLVLVLGCGGDGVVLVDAGGEKVATLNMVFVHRSCGRNLLAESDPDRDPATYVRALLDSRVELWDHDYQPDRLYDADCVLQGGHYAVPYCGAGYHPGAYNTYPAGWHYIWTSSAGAAVACRENLLDNHDVIIFKSCYPCCDINSQAQLDAYKTWYTAIRNFCVQQSAKKFVFLTPPPRVPPRTNATAAGLARDYATWMEWMLAGRRAWNCYCFNFFDLLADDNGMLKAEYQRSPGTTDSHPSVVANAAIAPLFADFLMEIVERPKRPRGRLIATVD